MRDGFQSFELEPKQQTRLTFRLSVTEDAGTSDLQAGSRKVFLDPTTINIIVERKHVAK